MNFTIAFFDAKPYDRGVFDEANRHYAFRIVYHEVRLNGDNVVLARGADAACLFVHDKADAAIIRQMSDYGVKLLAPTFL